jgi:hypothetical protein
MGIQVGRLPHVFISNNAADSDLLAVEQILSSQQLSHNEIIEK